VCRITAVLTMQCRHWKSATRDNELTKHLEFKKKLLTSQNKLAQPRMCWAFWREIGPALTSPTWYEMGPHGPLPLVEPDCLRRRRNPILLSPLRLPSAVPALRRPGARCSAAEPNPTPLPAPFFPLPSSRVFTYQRGSKSLLWSSTMPHSCRRAVP
jgi:hypothetical protein